MKHKTFIKVLAVALAMTGCKVQKKSEAAAVKAAKTKPANTQPKQVTNRELRLEDVFVEFEGQAQPNVYNMILSWPETRDRVRISVDGQVMFAVNTTERQTEAVANLQGGRKVAVLVEILDQQYHIITSETRELEVPKDYVFPNQFTLTNHMKIPNERVFLNNSVVTTGNFNLEIQTKKLIVLNRSTIQGFIPGAKAAHGNDGRSGGLISIEAEYAEGELTFTMNSEAGGDALMGYYMMIYGSSNEHVVCPLGTNGFTAGRNGDLKLKIKDISNFRHYPQETLSDGGKTAPIIQNKESINGYPQMPSHKMFGGKHYDCPKRPSPGGGAQLGKICQTFSGQVPAQGCE
ncbi:hypothetical protein [Pseudobdellovibrio sp. HCB154]|uniref:hypothetical protein n=1 Tax=Pseudobdellovibrio sp. HCB154 TaxID=3386277 RepID=UPI003916D1D5